MTIKTLTVTEKAYETLKRLKYNNESFSEVIVRVAGSKVGAAAKFHNILKLTDKERNDLIGRIKKRKEEINKESNERIKKIRDRLK